MSKMIQISATIKAPLVQVWDAYNNPDDIKQWNQASPDWHCPSSENDLRVGGVFKNRMEAKDGSFGFDFEGVYLIVSPHSAISYRLLDDRQVNIRFQEVGTTTNMVIDFDPENENPIEMQQQGWQAILNNFKAHVENK